eukprot:11848606-Alexandrium_andersonii.AAC.1
MTQTALPSPRRSASLARTTSRAVRSHEATTCNSAWPPWSILAIRALPQSCPSGSPGYFSHFDLT